MNTIAAIVAVLWFGRIVGNILSYAHLWYIKEYRPDRMLVHLATYQGKRILIIPWKLPPLSPKSITLIGVTLLSLSAAYLLLPWPVLPNIALLDILTFPVTFAVVVVLRVPTVIIHELKIACAVKKLRAHKPMYVIGITGSYGKTSTKEYLSILLGVRYNVLKTEASKNSPIGIAETILSELEPSHEAFVVEMGAYRPGEIARMARMVRPGVGIITAINPQHQDLFGSMGTTKRAKYELIQGLPRNGIAIFNADNDYTRQMAQQAKQDGYTVWLYTKEEGVVAGVVARKFRASNIVADLRHVGFEVRCAKQTCRVSARVLGEHQVSNILAAIAGAVACGIPLSEAAKAASRITPVPKVLEVVQGKGGVTLINDTFNNNPDAAKAALAFLAKTKGKKILVFQPMIELGTYTERSHEDVGEYAAQICDEIILTNRNFEEYIRMGAKRTGNEKHISVLSSRKAATYLRSIVTEGDTVLFKGKEAEQVLNILTASG